MNLFDMKTIIISYVISNAICMAVVFILWIQNRRRFEGLGFWLADFIMQSLALLLVALRGAIPDLLSMTVSNTLAIGGTILLYMGLERFVGKRSAQWHNLLLLVVFIPPHVYFVIHPNLDARNILFSLGLLAVCAQSAWLMLRRVDAVMSSLTRAVGMLFVAYSLISIVRVVIDSTTPSNNNFFQSGLYDTLAVLLYQMLFIILTFGLFLMVNLRLTHDLEQDIRARAEAEAASSLNEEKFQKAFHSSPDSVTISRLKDGKITEVNEGFLHITGYAREEVLGDSAFALKIWANPQDRGAFIKTLQEQQKIHGAEYDFRAKSGQIINGLLTAEIIQLGGEPHILSVVHDITQRKQTLETLQQREELYHSIFELTQDAVVITTLDGQIVDANPAAAKMFGYSLDEVRQMHTADFFVDPQAREKFIAHMQQYGKIKDNETLLKRKDGSHFWVLGSGSILHAPGLPPRLLNTLRDITERKQTEAAVASLAKFPSENPNPVMRVDGKGVILYANQSSTPILNVWQRQANQTIPTDWQELVASILVSGQTHEDEMECEGNLFALTITPVANENYVNIYGRDITERKRSEELVQARLRLIQFADSHTLGELLQKTLDEAEALTDSKIGFFHFVEQDQNTLSLQAWSTRTMQDFCKAEGQGMHYDLANAGVWVDCVRERRPIVHNDYASLPNRQGMPPGHAQVVRELVVPVFRDNQIMAIMGVGNKPQDYSERDVEVVSYIADIVWETTARKRAEEATMKLNAELEQRVLIRTAELKASNRELESISYNIAHDMRSPVRAIRWYSARLQQGQGGKMDDNGRAELGTISIVAKRLGLLIDGFLEYLRLGRITIRKRTVQMESLVNSTKERLLAGNPGRQIQVSIGALPECHADPELLQQVWENLLDNAIKFTRTRDQAKIEIGAGEKDGEIYYFIRDNGIGFDMKYADKMFILFQYLNSQEEYDGNGIGLAIVQRILHRHGGRIWVAAEPDKGAAFYFTLG